MRAKALALKERHQKQLHDGVPLVRRWIWTDDDIARLFVRIFGGRITEYRDEYPWRLLYDAAGEFVAYVKNFGG